MAETMEAKKHFYYLHGAAPDRLLAWWSSLDENRGLRARLRRVERPDDALLTEAFFNFLEYVPPRWAETEHLYASALVACALAQVRHNQPGRSFAAQLGGGEDVAVMSDLRFRQLIKSRTPEEFFRRLIRAIRMLNGGVNILSLVEGILRWYDEYQTGPDRNPVNRLSVLWAKDYYLPSNSSTTSKGTE
ncbi:type I-E CRISPR-associated protein Cse2/CasB [Spongiibacter taiwanensis]|uniref:type I-E CRISPR-associated protein Cse2/CasB n=1 Tax=Spongiibacter taiwanensis TaxID=1748242 RepID=UPI002034FEA6|nr:type I-E CRISPR-associated protein Cse2/CasB [Spongiibacter taiwanensis]USA43087.1 type I-E CRISPR-associated protein Cse2/CasB [Spongiibacter taiwanensis]